MRSNIEGALLSANLLGENNRFKQIVQTLTGTFTMDDDMPQLLFLDPGGAGRTVLLPAETKGLFYIIVNTADAAETLTVKEDGNSTTIGTVEQDTLGLFFCNGTTWFDLTVFAEAFLDGVTAGTVTASKAVVVDANKDAASFRDITTRKVAIGDSANDHTITITSSGDEAANRTASIPLLGGNDTFDMLGVAQTLTGNKTFSGTVTAGSDATDRVALKGVYMSPANVAVTVPAITDPDIAKVDVDVSAAFSMQPAVGDAVIAIPQEAMETNARILGAYVTATDQITVVFGSEGGNVTGGAKNFKFLVIDVT